MHGIIFNQLINFIRENNGADALNNILDKSGIGDKTYKINESHADEELERIISSTCREIKKDRDEVLESFGEFIAPSLLDVYSPFIEEEWDALDLLENIENTIHRTVRLRNPEADPPELKIERRG